MFLGLGNWLLARFRVSFHVHGDGPDKAQQFSSNRDYDFGFVLASAQQVAVALMQPVLGLPGNFFDLLAEPLCWRSRKAQPQLGRWRYDQAVSMTTRRR